MVGWIIVLRPNGDCIEYMRETIDYTITIIPLTIIPLTMEIFSTCHTDFVVFVLPEPVY
jgi:hypothetical protein